MHSQAGKLHRQQQLRRQQPDATGGMLQAQRQRCSHVARVQSRRRPQHQPDDGASSSGSSSSGSSSVPRKQRLGSSDGLQLNPPPKLHGMRGRSSAAGAGGLQQQTQQQLDWRSYRAKLVQMDAAGLLAPGRSSPIPFEFAPDRWLHRLPAPEPGCVLLAARSEGMGFFDRTAVLLVAHDDTHGSVGFVLNKPSPLRMSEVQLSATAQGILDVFGAQRLQLGGPVHMETLTLLHGFSGLAGGQKVSEGVYYGGLPSAVQLVRAGLAAPEDFRLMLGMTGWAPGQLQHECDAGAWVVAAAGRGLVLPPCSQLVGKAPESLWRAMRERLARQHAA